MLMSFLIGLLFVLIGTTGLQFFYLFYVDRLNRERRNYIKSLERRNRVLTAELGMASSKLAEREKMLVTANLMNDVSEEIWDEVIEDI